ncbi:MAG: hypothetical protein OXD50_16830 [Chloroflexi bacterium]|nr:hypothetical protein [Chloroflexota bacterium]
MTSWPMAAAEVVMTMNLSAKRVGSRRRAGTQAARTACESATGRRY